MPAVRWRYEPDFQKAASRPLPFIAMYLCFVLGLGLVSGTAYAAFDEPIRDALLWGLGIGAFLGLLSAAAATYGIWTARAELRRADQGSDAEEN